MTISSGEVGNAGHEEPATKRMRVTLADDEVNTELSVKASYSTFNYNDYFIWCGFSKKLQIIQ